MIINKFTFVNLLWRMYISTSVNFIYLDKYERERRVKGQIQYIKKFKEKKEIEVVLKNI